MAWSPDRDALRKRVAVVAGANTDVDGSQPDIWRFIEEIREPGLDASLDDYR